MIVTLSDSEMAFAEGIGRLRYETNRKGGQLDGRRMNSDPIFPDLIGAKAELAVAKGLGLPWDGKLFSHQEWQYWRRHGHDVGPVEVRATAHYNGRLIIKKSDDDYSPFVLVRTNMEPNFYVVGWQWGIVGKKPEYWENVGHGFSFFVPRNKLRPIKSLIEGLGLCNGDYDHSSR